MGASYQRRYSWSGKAGKRESRTWSAFRLRAMSKLDFIALRVGDLRWVGETEGAGLPKICQAFFQFNHPSLLLLPVFQPFSSPLSVLALSRR